MVADIFERFFNKCNEYNDLLNVPYSEARRVGYARRLKHMRAIIEGLAVSCKKVAQGNIYKVTGSFEKSFASNITANRRFTIHYNAGSGELSTQDIELLLKYDLKDKVLNYKVEIIRCREVIELD